MKSLHPFEPFVPKNSTKLIIGTIPPPRFCKNQNNILFDDVYFYYGSQDNYFWPILGDIFNVKFDYNNSENAILQRKKLLENLKIGVTDIVESCIHESGSAIDKDLKDIELKDLGSLLQKHPEINLLIYTSSFVKSQINKLFGTYHSINPNNKREQILKIGEKVYKVKILYSPSPSALRGMGKNGAEKRKTQYEQFFKG